MKARDEKTADTGPVGTEKETTGQHPGHDENCRCKETAKMTPRELIELMVNDLAFWRKEKKG
jgi:hypothetical protein